MYLFTYTDESLYVISEIIFSFFVEYESPSSHPHFFSCTCAKQVPFGYTRKDVLLIGIGTTVLGVGLKSGLEVFSLLQFLSAPVLCLLEITSLPSVHHFIAVFWG